MDRLLRDEEIGDNLDLDMEASYKCSDGSTSHTISVEALLQAQDAKTHEADCREFGEWASGLLEAALRGDYSSGNDFFGTDEGRVRAAELFSGYEKDIERLVTVMEVKINKLKAQNAGLREQVKTLKKQLRRMP